MKQEQAFEILSKATRIGVIRTDRLGDMVLTLPLLLALRKAYPSAELHLLARNYVQPLVQNSAIIDQCHFIEESSYDATRSFICSVSPQVCFFPRPVFAEVLAATIAHVPLRIGSAYRWYSSLFNAGIKDHRSTAEFHEAEYNVRMLSTLQGSDAVVELMRPSVDHDATARVAAWLNDRGINSEERVVILHPGSGGSSRSWPIERFAQLAKALSQTKATRVVLSGIASEAQLCEEIRAIAPLAISAAGQLSMEDMFALISRSSLFVANSTGMLHCAAALGCAVVGFYPNSPHLSARRWGPYTKRSVVLSPPQNPSENWNDDMSQIDLDLAISACRSLLDSESPVKF